MQEFLDSRKPIANVACRGEYLVNCFGQNRRVEHWSINHMGVVYPVAKVDGDDDYSVIPSNEVFDSDGNFGLAALERADVLKEFKKCN